MRAVVDIGSNSIKYTLERTWGDASSQVTKSRVIALGKKLKPGSPLPPDALERLESALQDFAPYLRTCGKQIVVVGTAALRSCSNPEVAMALVKRHLGVTLHIIPGKSEAKLSFLGASLHSPFKNPLCIDVGGASTEVGLIHGDQVTSVPWGALRVHENILLSQVPVNSAVWSEAQNQLDQIFLSELRDIAKIDFTKVDGILAIGGSLMMCAKSLYPEQASERTVNASMDLMRKFNDKIALLSSVSRTSTLGFSSDRADIACAGLMCLFAATSLSQTIDNALITEGGLRNGVLERWSDFLVS